MDTVKEWCKKARDLGVLVGVGTHKPEVIAKVEEENWDVDFYAGCVYNRTRTAEEWKKVLNGEMMEMPGDIYLQSDPARMYKVMRQTKKPCFAFKILAAGRIPDRGVEQAFRTAFESIKPIDGVFVGMFPRVKDEVRENAEIVHRHSGGFVGSRASQAAGSVAGTHRHAQQEAHATAPHVSRRGAFGRRGGSRDLLRRLARRRLAFLHGRGSPDRGCHLRAAHPRGPRSRRPPGRGGQLYRHPTDAGISRDTRRPTGRASPRWMPPAATKFGKRFAELAAEQQADALIEVEENLRAFFDLILTHTRQGFYGDPRHGGNRNMASWKMLGLPFPPVRGRQHYDDQPQVG